MAAADSAADEVALDFQDSLQDLQINNRYEISNLTIIAKENTEYAQAISAVLEKHIKTVSRLWRTGILLTW
jgi:pre-mRNA cleavage complex 2 protein Pcf11